MNKEINFQHLIILVLVLILLYYFITKATTKKREKFDNIDAINAIEKKNKTCSQDSINVGVKDYIFSTRPFAR